MNPSEDIQRSLRRRDFIRAAAAGTVVLALGGLFVLTREDDPRAKEKRPDGRPRLPPGQRLLAALRPMGGDPGDPSPARFRLRVFGEVERPFELDFAALLAMPQTRQRCDVHCVTGWSMFDADFAGVRVRDLAERAGLRARARHVIFEAAEGYTANVPLADALAPDVLVAHQYFGESLPRPHGPPARALVPSLYFWKSAKWLTGIRFTAQDEPGFWETRGYHNHADPWLEERYG